MDRCINISHPEFKELVRQSNINPLILKSKVGVWQEKNNTDKFPTLEELGIGQETPIADIKEGVSELFESNPELANAVYEVLGYGTSIIQDNKSYYRGQIEKPTIDKNGNLVLHAKEDELYKKAGLKSKGVSMTDDLQSAIEYGNGQLDVSKNLASEENVGVDLERELDRLDENGYYLIQIPKNISNEIVKEAGEVKVIGDKIVIPKGQYKIEQVVGDVETQITTQQKQQAQQLYSQYLDTTTNPTIEGFKNFIKGKQFQKLTAEEKAKTIEQITKEHRSITALKDLAHKLAHRIGGEVEFEYRTDVDYKGYNQGMKSVLNEAYMTPDTPLHEVLAHPIIRVIKESKPELYRTLIKELETGRGKEVLDRIKRDYTKKITQSLYPEEIYIDSDKKAFYTKFQELYYIEDDIYYKVDTKLPNYNINNSNFLLENRVKTEKYLYDYYLKDSLNYKETIYTLEEQQEEALVTLLGMMAADKLDKIKDATLISKLKELWKQISDFVKSLLRQDEIRIDELPITTTLSDLAEIMAYGDNKIILPGYKVEYSTPLGNKYDTLEEVNNEIRGLADANVEVDLSSVSINDIKIDKNNLPSDFKNYYTSSEAEIAFMKDAKYNDEYNNKIQELRDKYAGKFIVVEKSDYGVYPDTTENQNFYNTKEEADNAALDKSIERYKKEKAINDFIEKNKEYEQSKEIIEEWKKVNNIQYNPEEVYSRGQEFVSVVGAYSDFDVNLIMQNLLQHIEDNQKAGGEFTISAFTKPINRLIPHLEGGGGKIKFKIYPQSNDIKWAANTDVFSGSVWDASEKVSKDKESELLGVSYTKYPSLQNVNAVQPNLASIIDNLAYHHNELGISLTGSNFRLEYDKDIPYTTKKIIDSINSILDQKYGKLVKPDIKKQGEKVVKYGLFSKGANDILDWFDTKEEAQAKVDESNKQLKDLGEPADYSVKPITKPVGIQPTQTNETLKESIEDVKDRVYVDDSNYDLNLKRYEQAKEGIVDEYYSAYTDLQGKLDKKIHVMALSKEITKGEQAIGMWQIDEDYDTIKNYIVGEAENKHGVKFWILSNEFKTEALSSYKKPIKSEKEYTSQALVNTKIAKLKEVAKKYPRSLITSKVVPINPNMVDNSEIQYSKVEQNSNNNNNILKQDTQIKEKYFKESNTTTVSKILKDISESEHPLNKLAQKLLEYSEINDIEIELVDAENLGKNEISGVTGIAEYNSVNRKIRIAEKAYFIKGMSEATILHEILHAFSHDTIYTHSRVSSDFKVLYNYSKRFFSKYNPETNEGEYATFTEDEFFVALFTNANFIKALSQIPAFDYTTVEGKKIRGIKYHNFFEQVFDYLLGLLKIEKGDSLYKQAFEVATNILEEAKYYTEANKTLSLDDLPFSNENKKISSNVPQSSQRVSTKDNPIIIPINDNTKELYRKEGLLINGKTERISTQEKLDKVKEKVKKYNADPTKKYSMAIRKIDQSRNGSIYTVFLAEKFVGDKNGIRDISEVENDIKGGVGRVSSKFQSSLREPTNNDENILSYLAFKKDLKIALQKKLEEYKINHINIKGTTEYKSKIIEFNRVLSNLKNEIEKVDIKDSEVVFKVFIDEIDELNSVIQTMSPHDFSDFEVDDRIEKLLNMFLNESLKNNDFQNNVVIDGEKFDNYNIIINKLIELKTNYKKSYAQITLNLLKENPLYFAKTYNLNEEELKNFEESLKQLTEDVDDINEFQEKFLGSNSNDDSIGILVADISLKYNLQKVQEIVFKYCEDLKNLDSQLTQEFKDKNLSFDIFFEKDAHGVETGKLIHVFSSEYFDELEKFQELNDDFNYAKKEDKLKLYRGKISWLKVNTEVIDFRKLLHFKNIYGDRYSEYFTFSESEMLEYENLLKKALGKYYDILIEEIEEKLEDFEIFKQSKEIEGSEYSQKHIFEESPWEFLKNYYNTFDVRQAWRTVPYDHNGNEQRALLRGNYITFVPRKSVKEGRYYNKNFDAIQESDNMFKYWNILRILHNKHIDPVLTSQGYDVHNITYAKFLKDGAEILADTKDKKWMSRIWNSMLKKFKDIWIDTRTVKDSNRQDEVVKNYSDNTKAMIKRFKSLIALQSDDELIKMLDERQIVLDKSKKLSKSEIAEIIARHDVLSMYSKDLTKITLAIADLATLHRARLETAASIEVVKRYNATIKDKNGKDRVKSQKKLDSWVNNNIYNNRESEALSKEDLNTITNFGKIFNDTDKKLIDIVRNVRDNEGNKSFVLDGIRYVNVDNIYKTIDEDGNQSTITKEVFESSLTEYLSNILNQRGTPITGHSIITGILKILIIQGLGWNFKSGVRNRVEGSLTNIIRDSQGDMWETGTINYARAFMSGINITRLSEGRLTISGKERVLQQKTFIELFQNLGIYEDRKNELDRKNTVSKFGKFTRNINMFTVSVDMPEFKNQGEIVFCMLANLKVKDKYGNEYSFFNRETMEFTLFEPGTTIIKDDFRTPENLGWETFQLNKETTNQFYVYKNRIDEIIKQTQGNYSNLDSIMFQDSLYGKAIMLFMRWFPEHLNQRFGKRKFNIVQENSSYTGRYRAMYNNPALLGIGTTATLLATFGPSLTLALGAGGFLVLPFVLKMLFAKSLKVNKQIVLQKYTLASTVAMLQEVLIQSLNLPLKVTRFKKANISLFKKFSVDNLVNETSDFSKEEIRAIKGMCMEIAIMLDGILLYIALKALGQALGAGDDDDEDKEKRKHSKDWDKLAITYFFNYVSNTGKQLIDSFLSYANPLTIFNQNSKISLIRLGDKLIKLLDYIEKYNKGEERGGIKMADEIMTFQPFLPIPNSIKDAFLRDADKIGEGQYPFFDKKIYRDDIWMEKLFLSEEKKAKKILDAKRGVLKEDLQIKIEDQLRKYNDENLTEYEIEEKAEEIVKEIVKETYKNGNRKSKKSSRRSRGRKGTKNKTNNETYEEALERFENNEDNIRDKYGL
jgi:hypothetical protein